MRSADPMTRCILTLAQKSSNSQSNVTVDNRARPNTQVYDTFFFIKNDSHNKFDTLNAEHFIYLQLFIMSAR